MSEFWSFRRMVTPVVVQFLFVLGCIAVVITGIGLLVAGVTHKHTSQALGGFSLIVFGPLIVRIYAEVMIVVFRINETLTDLRELAVWASDRAYAEDAMEDDEEGADAP